VEVTNFLTDGAQKKCPVGSDFSAGEGGRTPFVGARLAREGVTAHDITGA
jgi:hypothetical protein